MGFDSNLLLTAQNREQDRELERDQQRLATEPIEPRTDPEADTDPAMPDGTTPLERDQRPIDRSR